MTGLRESALILGVVSVGLIAGLFASFAYAVMPGLGQTDDKSFVSSMQRINVVIVNPLFLLLFFGGLGFTVIAAATYRDHRMFWWIVAGAVLYGLGLVITMAFNIPLNNKLEAAGDPDRIGDLRAVRDVFEASWVRWNIARAAVHTAAFAVLVIGAVTR
ncbi:anthrone oxygenase family protein [Williamsia sp. 1135]|uniref:anthrone oxygenase family protein n=1 Tax=Williamsia sp. 1135 TaxID=1889262 RepID=UPI000A11C456|nr:anthrone oxygenase family protein [Williamsia sp. 1135]ORM34156.1 hypothetical protein BFL43_12075 [Williamsia sp. 1135]